MHKLENPNDELSAFNEQFEMYYQKRYDFDPNSLSLQDIKEIKDLASEKRNDYGIAPIGRDVFRYIIEKERNVYFELEKFENLELDALIYIPDPNQDIAFIIINSNQPLLNQIFATAHEYYHYLKDLDELRNNPRACSLSSLKDKSEQKASRFAAEFLLPDQALKSSIERWLIVINKNEFKNANLEEVAALCYILTIKFCLPLKAVFFRLCEEGYIKDPNKYISQYAFIKKIFKETKTSFSKEVKELLNKENPYIDEPMYDLIYKAYNNGYVSLDDLESEIKILGLDKTNFYDLFINKEDDEQEDIDDDIKAKLLKKFRG